MRLIDSTKLIDALPVVAEDKKISLIGAVADMVMLISEQPVIESEPVRHGRWEEMHYEGGILDGTNFDRCSICGYERVFDGPALKTVFKYCPNCGAKMDGGAE